MPAMYEVCERLDVDYAIRLTMNPGLKNYSDSLLKQAVSQWEQIGEPQRMFAAFRHQADSWPVWRWGVVKCKAMNVLVRCL